MQERARRSTAAAKHDPLTLLVALDSKGEASGDLYLDDGSTFAYARGVHAHRLFTFKDGVLRAAALPGSPSPSSYSTKVIIERVVIVGLQHPASSYAAKDAATGAALQAGAGPVVLQAGIPDDALVIRKPQLPVAGNWAIQLSVTA